MAISRVTVWTPGQILTASALNAEFNNVLNNPLTLISPTTGNINFNSNQATNFGLEILGADPASVTSGRVIYQNVKKIVEVDDGTIIRSIPAVPSTNVVVGDLIVSATSASGAWKVLPVGTTGQLLSVTSTGVLGWIAPAAATTQAVVKTSEGGTGQNFSTANFGSLIIVTSSATGVFGQLNIGSTGQVLTVTSSSGILGWATPAAAAAGVGGFTSSSVTYYDTFVSLEISVIDTADALATKAFRYLGPSSGMVLSTMPSGGLSFPASATIESFAVAGVSTGITQPQLMFVTSLQPDMTINILTPAIAGTRRIGLTTAAAMTIDPTNGVYFRATAAASTWFAVCRNAGTSFTVATTAVGSTAFQALRIQVTASGGANVYTNGILAAGTFTSSQPPLAAVGLSFGGGFDTAASTGFILNAWQVVQNRPVTV